MLARDDQRRTPRMLDFDELGTDGAQLDVHRSSGEAGANYG
jgi:hypothetical protein